MLFRSYVTTKAHGTGLGLAIVKKMVDEHGGQIKIENIPTGGASVTILLPIEAENLKQKSLAPHTKTTPIGNSTVTNSNIQNKSVKEV